MRPWRKLRRPSTPLRLVGSPRDYAEEHHAMLEEANRLLGGFQAASPACRVAILQEVVGIHLAARRLSEAYQRQARLRRSAR